MQPQSLPLRSLFLVSLCLGGAQFAWGCSGNESSPGDSSPGGATSDGDASDDGDDGGTAQSGSFWYISSSTPSVGIAQLSGEREWSELLEDGTPRALTLGAGSAWVVTSQGELRRYDEKTGKLLASIKDIALNPSHLTFAAGSLWLAEDDDDSDCTSVTEGPAKVLRIDPKTNEVIARIAVSATDSSACNRFLGLQTDGERIFSLIHNSFGIAAIDPSTNEIVQRVALGADGGYGTGELAVSGEKVWVQDSNQEVLILLDAEDLEIQSKTDLPSGDLSATFATPKSVLFRGTESDILRVDAEDPAKQRSLSLEDHFEDLLGSSPFDDNVDTFAFHKGGLYVAVRPELTSFLLRLDPVTLKESSRVELDIFTSLSAIAFIP